MGQAQQLEAAVLKLHTSWRRLGGLQERLWVESGSSTPHLRELLQALQSLSGSTLRVSLGELAGGKRVRLQLVEESPRGHPAAAVAMNLQPRRMDRRFPGLWLLLALVLLAGLSAPLRAQPAVPVNVLMPAPFADATAATVQDFNRSHPGIRLVVTRGPFETEAVSDLAISSLLLGDSPYDLLLMDVTWTAKYAAAGWLLPLEDRLRDPLAGVGVRRAGGQLDRRPPLAGADGGLHGPALLADRSDGGASAHPQRAGVTLPATAAAGPGALGASLAGPPVRGADLHFPRGPAGLRRQLGPEVGPGLGLDSPEAAAAAAWLRQLVGEGISPPAVANFAEPETLQAFARR